MSLYRAYRTDKEAFPVFSQLIKHCPELSHCQNIYLSLVERYGSAERITTALQETTQWLAQHLDDTSTLASFICGMKYGI